MRGYNQSIIKPDEFFEVLCLKNTLRESFKAVKKNRGAPGIDGETIAEFERSLDTNLTQLVHELKTWAYNPQPVRWVEIPKPGGGVRILGIPCVRDRVVQAALKSILEPHLDPQFSNNSYGFRPGRNQRQAVLAAQEIVATGRKYVVDIDLAKFFDTINHDRLIHRLGLSIADKRILRMVGKILRSGIIKDGVVKATPEGSTQGSPLSPLLSNVVLDELDKELEGRGLMFCRYADDANIFVGSQKAADRVMESVSRFIESKLKLKVNKDKSKVGLSKVVRFLGMTIIGGTLAISALSMNRAMAKVKELTPRGTHLTLEQTIKRINFWYMGWSAYYAMTEYPNQLSLIEAHIRRRLRMRIVCQQKKSRNLVKHLVSRGVTGKTARKAAYAGGKWVKSRSRGVEIAYPNRWFIDDMGLKVRSDENQRHWFNIRKWIKVA